MAVCADVDVEAAAVATGADCASSIMGYSLGVLSVWGWKKETGFTLGRCRRSVDMSELFVRRCRRCALGRGCKVIVLGLPLYDGSGDIGMVR